MDCLFCKIVAGEIPSHKIFENERVFAFLDIFPSNPGHTLVIPKSHHENLLVTPPELAHELLDVVQQLTPRIMETVDAAGANVIINMHPASGQIIMHTHYHIVPRFVDDGLQHFPQKEMSHEELARVAEKIRAVV